MTGLHQDRRSGFSQEQIDQLEQLMRASTAPIHLQLAAGEKRMDTLQEGIAFNNAQTQEMREAFEFAKRGLRVLGWIGSVITRFWPIWVMVAGYFGLKFKGDGK